MWIGFVFDRLPLSLTRLIDKKVADFLSASFVRLGGKSKSSPETSATTAGGSTTTSNQSEDAELQQGGKAGWDKEMEEKKEGWEKEWDEERQRFYYVSVDTLEATYTAPFKISVSLFLVGARSGNHLKTLRRVP